MNKPKIAFVIQRYGLDVVGGAELQCRLLAEALLPYYEIDVLTTCALDYNSWANHYPTGTQNLNGIVVHRFPTIKERHTRLNRWWSVWKKRKRTIHDEIQWVYEQGPYVPDLLSFITAKRDEYPVFIFSTYLYFPTVFGMPLVADKAIFLPNANPKEIELFFTIFKQLFHIPRAIIYNTEEERRYVHKKFHNKRTPNEIVGLGFAPYKSNDPSRFSKKFHLNKPYLLFLGRIGPNKGCDLLVKFFLDYLKKGGTHFQLVFAGSLEMTLPEDPHIRYVGFIDKQDKADALLGCSAVISSSLMDCLSMQSCEAWAAARPVLVYAKSPVVTGLCRRARGGAIYANSRQFSKLLFKLENAPEWAAERGKNGKAFIEKNYNWKIVIAKLHHLIQQTLSIPK